MQAVDPQPQTGLVSVMMPAYNAERYIAHAVQSVLDQTYTQWELLVVNDGSTDGTEQVVRGFGDPRIRLINKTNGGESTARNMALDHSKGDFIAFLDADDLFEPHHLARTVAYLQAHPECDAVYTDGMYIDPDGAAVEPLSSRRRGPFEGDIFEALVRASDVFGPPICILLRRAAVKERGLRFDPRIVIGPDWEFFTRFAETTRFGYIPEVTCRYRLHATSISVSTGSVRRRASLALCREKAIHLERFTACSLETRVYAFYDLLVELLAGFPERQADVTTWPQFEALPARERARLFRLMANRAVLDGGQPAWARACYRRAAALQPADVRNLIAVLVDVLSPGLSRWLVRSRQVVLRK